MSIKDNGIMTNIAIIIPKLNGGGAERVASNLSIELASRYNVTLIVFDGKNQAYPHGGQIVDLSMPPAESKVGKIATVIRRIFAVRRLKLEKEIDCSISLLEGPNVVNILSRRNEKIITSIRNMPSKENFSFGRKKLISIVSNKSDMVVALSELVKLDLINNFQIREDKINTIYNSCDKDRLMDLAKAEPLFEIEGRYIVTVGRNSIQKGQWHLIRAFKLVHGLIPDLKLVILGEGELQIKLKELTNDLQLKDYIIFGGYIKNPHNIINDSIAFVFSSLYEGLGNALLEALALNKAIISTDCDAGPREILAPNTPLNYKTKDIQYAQYGVLVPTFTYDHFNCEDELTPEEICLANAIVKIVLDESLRKSYEEKASMRSRDFYPQNVNGNWIKMIDALVSNRGE
ncbi:MAG: glycosyltransferase [Oscillospiraceae bacterium]